MPPKISIVIPCYNHGKLLKEALLNLENLNSLYEILIVNDGSTEEDTIKILSDLKAKGYKIIEQENKGLAAARNTGISFALGEYIMFLDSDNKLEPRYLRIAAEILNNDKEIVVVYSDAQYFGKKSGYWKVGEFNLQKLMIANYIDACAMVRKSVFDELGGYDVNKLAGWEDWEMWLRLAFARKKFYYVPEIGFWYRVEEGSMSAQLGKSFETRNRVKEYLHLKYPNLLGQEFITDFVINRFKNSPVKFVTKLIMISWFNKIYQKLLKKNKLIKGI